MSYKPIDDIVNRLQYTRYESVDNLVDRLQYVRYVKQIDKSINGSRIKTSSNLSYSKSISDIFLHLNQKMMLGIVDLGPNYTSENDIANLLYDLKTFPREVIIDRLKREGATIQDL